VKQAIILDAEHLEEPTRKLSAFRACDSHHSERKMMAAEWTNTDFCEGVSSLITGINGIALA
jgi:hypothetical protein